MSAFTPGPWEVKPVELGVPYLRVRGTRLGLRYKVANVLTVSDHPAIRDRDIAETTANAHLIAAAPDLYEALEACLSDHPGVRLQPEAIHLARAALARARGESP